MGKLEAELIERTAKKVEELNNELKSMLQSKRKLDSGSKALGSMVVVKNTQSLYTGIVGVDYMYYVIHGRGPGRLPPPYPNGTWPLPYPAALKLAKYGNLAKYRPVADAFDDITQDFFNDIEQEAGEVMISYLLTNQTIATNGSR